jgi:catechol 2,3-dioxygenase-like lactoylglutathione lyase family enzyme
MNEAVRLERIRAFRIVSADPARLANFYVAGLGFSRGETSRIAAAEMAVLGLAGEGWRTPLMLGRQRVDLDGYEQPGQSEPHQGDAAALNFQHLALVTTDARDSYTRALNHGAAAISVDGPVALPPSAGGVVAGKFRDPEGHPLEFLQLPKDSRPGIDHSAISVSDVESSEAYYGSLGLKIVGRTLNRGETQDALDGLDGACVDVIALSAPDPAPHLELLGYRRPLGRRTPALRANDILATRIVWACDRDGLIRDPDGHLHQLESSG